MRNKSHNNADRIYDGLVVSTNNIFDEMSCTDLFNLTVCKRVGCYAFGKLALSAFYAGFYNDHNSLIIVSPSAFSRRAVVSYWRKYVHEVLVSRLGGLSLPRKSVVRLTDRPDMTLDVYRGRKTTIQQQSLIITTLTQHRKDNVHFDS